MSGSRLRHGLKAGAGRIGALLALPLWGWGSRTVLAYHNIVEDGDEGRGDVSLHLPRSRFRAQLALLSRQARIEPLEQLLAHPSPGGTRARVAITFDDGYRGAIRIGTEELRRVGAPATFFLCPGRMGGPPFWWDRFAAEGTGLSPVLRERSLTECRGVDALVAARAAELGIPEEPSPPFPDSYHPADATEIEKALEGDPLFTVGAHSWSHPNLAALTAAELAEELKECRDDLRRRFPLGFRPFLTYPYGLDSKLVREQAHEVGMEASFRVEGGSLKHRFTRSSVDAQAHPRLNVPAGMAPGILALRIAGRSG